MQPDVELTEHPAINNWSILESGSVKISEAGIMLSSAGGLDDINCTIVGPSTESDWTKIAVQQDVNLHNWIHSYMPQMPNYAVCTIHSARAHLGIILKEIMPGVLIKVGSYWQNGLPRGPPIDSQPVQWLVL
jgi:hypothetical protein